ncbi:hypothetical protein AAE478_008571 [Parahypoxylon ruwenzoriense]
MASRIPPLLDPYLRLPPEASLVLLSGVLGSTTNWLVHRYLNSLLSTTSNLIPKEHEHEHGHDAPDVNGASVILVSFLRDYAFWRDGTGKLGTDLDIFTRKGRFIFVDGLTSLFHASHGSGPKSLLDGATRGRALTAPTLQHLRKELEDAIARVQRSAPERPAILIADQLDLLLAASGDDISSQALRDMLLGIRERVHSSIVTLSVDEPLISSQTTSLEKHHAAFAVSLAHDANLVISLRKLDTGTARDVSGVLRVTSGGGNHGIDRVVEERELLYFVTGDGGVRVFERGQ